MPRRWFFSVDLEDLTELDADRQRIPGVGDTGVEISVTWTSPSTPPRSTNAPEPVSETHAAVDHSPSLSCAQPRRAALVFSQTAARDTTSFRSSASPTP
jgi:hypothetical protein